MALRSQAEDLEEDLNELENNLKRLRVEYEQYFMGNMRRPPSVLLGKVQKVILRFSNSPPLNTRYKFRFNQLNARFQMFRQHWGRTMREIENGTYKRHRFKADLRDRERNAPGAPTEESAASERRAKARKGDPMDQLADALNAARRKTGEHATPVDRAKLSDSIRKQTAILREQYADAKIRFKVVIEDNKAKVKASVTRPRQA